MTFIITNDSVGLLMQARRYDKNADQLAQILWNLNQLWTVGDDEATIMKQEMKHLIAQALVINDKLGKMHEKGLI